MKAGTKAINRTGEKYNRLTFIRPTDERKKSISNMGIIVRLRKNYIHTIILCCKWRN